MLFRSHELDRKNPFYDRDLIPNSTGLPPPFDFERLTRFMAYGFCMAPVQFKWFRFLSQVFPVTKSSAFAPAMKRVAFDQIIFAPFGLAVFYTTMTIAEGGGRRAVSNKLRDMYIPTLKANYLVWPAVQIVNFRLMPVQFQLVCQFAKDCLWPIANILIAFRVYNRYCLDSIPLLDQLRL